MTLDTELSFMLSVASEPHLAECHYAECLYAECHGSDETGHLFANIRPDQSVWQCQTR